jgi:hypothetical protein
LLHGDTRSPADTQAAGGDTEPLLGAYNFVIAEPTASEFAADEALIGNTRGPGARMVDISDGTSNTILFADSNVVESLSVKYTLSDADRDDLLPVGDAALDLNDLFIGDAVLDLNDLFIRDAAVDNGNDVPRTGTADGGASIKADHPVSDVMAFFTGVSTDPQGLLANGSPVLD